jgi:SNF2 family DNA or RNA helicase
MKLRPYQDEAADFLFARDRAMILAPVGAGKTAITLTAMTEMLARGFVDRWLVLAPKRVCTNVWPVEGQKWCPEFEIAVAVGTPAQRKAAFDSDADIVVTNYDNITSLDLSNFTGFTGVVFDELTKLKNPSGKRFKHLWGLIDRFNVRWGLTGSFTSNGLEDVFGQCKIIDQKLLGRSKGAFLQQYFHIINREYNQWSPNTGALEYIMAAIKPATYVLEPGEYKDKLPPLNIVEMPCDMDDYDVYEAMKKEFVVELDQTISAPTAAVMIQKLQQLAGGFIYGPQGPTWVSEHKFEMLDDILEENQRANTLIIYNYQEELAELKRRYPQLATMDDKNVVDKWNKGELELLALHPKSAGHGLNLQFGGNKMIWLSLPWSLELYEQTIGRIHRSGQTKDVWCYLIMCNNTIDSRILDALHNKRKIAELALDELA